MIDVIVRCASCGSSGEMKIEGYQTNGIMLCCGCGGRTLVSVEEVGGKFVLTAKKAFINKETPFRGTKDDAKKLLAELFAERQEWLDKELFRRMSDSGFSTHAVKNAIRDLGIHACHKFDHVLGVHEWYFRALPDKAYLRDDPPTL